MKYDYQKIKEFSEQFDALVNRIDELKNNCVFTEEKADELDILIKELNTINEHIKKCVKIYIIEDSARKNLISKIEI